MSAASADVFAALLDRARKDPAILAFWLGGSRGKGLAGDHSDYDCAVIAADEAYEPLRHELGVITPFHASWRPGVDLLFMTFPMFEAHAAWGAAEAWDRYSYAHVTALVDKTGRAQPMIDEKARVPDAEVPRFVAASLDHFLNQVYRAAKCARDGDVFASRLEAAEGIAPFLAALFAIHGGRLKPYYKYLAWELAEHPLAESPYDAETLVRRLAAVFGVDGWALLQQLMIDTRTLFCAHGYAATYEGWGGALQWMMTYGRGVREPYNSL